MTQQIFRALNQGALVTLRLFALTLLGAVPLGLVIALAVRHILRRVPSPQAMD